MVKARLIGRCLHCGDEVLLSEFDGNHWHGVGVLNEFRAEHTIKHRRLLKQRQRRAYERYVKEALTAGVEARLGSIDFEFEAELHTYIINDAGLIMSNGDSSIFENSVSPHPDRVVSAPYVVDEAQRREDMRKALNEPVTQVAPGEVDEGMCWVVIVLGVICIGALLAICLR